MDNGSGAGPSSFAGPDRFDYLFTEDGLEAYERGKIVWEAMRSAAMESDKMTSHDDDFVLDIYGEWEENIQQEREKVDEEARIAQANNPLQSHKLSKTDRYPPMCLRSPRLIALPGYATNSHSVIAPANTASQAPAASSAQEDIDMTDRSDAEEDEAGEDDAEGDDEIDALDFELGPTESLLPFLEQPRFDLCSVFHSPATAPPTTVWLKRPLFTYTFSTALSLRTFVDIFSTTYRRTAHPVKFSTRSLESIQRKIDAAVDRGVFDRLSRIEKLELARWAAHADASSDLPLGPKANVEDAKETAKTRGESEYYIATREFCDGFWEQEWLKGEDAMRNTFALTAVADWVNGMFYGAVVKSAISDPKEYRGREHERDSARIVQDLLVEEGEEQTLLVKLDPSRSEGKGDPALLKRMMEGKARIKKARQSLDRLPNETDEAYDDRILKQMQQGIEEMDALKKRNEQQVKRGTKTHRKRRPSRPQQSHQTRGHHPARKPDLRKSPKTSRHQSKWAGKSSNGRFSERHDKHGKSFRIEKPKILKKSTIHDHGKPKSVTSRADYQKEAAFQRALNSQKELFQTKRLEHGRLGDDGSQVMTG